IPPRPRPLRPIKNLPIRRKLQNLHIAQPISPRPLRHQLRRRMKSPRPSLPVKRRNHLQIPLRCLPAQLIRQRRHILLRQKRRLLRPSVPRYSGAQSARDHRHCNNLLPLLHICLRVAPASDGGTDFSLSPSHRRAFYPLASALDILIPFLLLFTFAFRPHSFRPGEPSCFPSASHVIPSPACSNTRSPSLRSS